MLDLAGESAGGTTQCPGTGCSRWDNAAGSYEDKVKATIGCEKCEGHPPDEESQVPGPQAQVEDTTTPAAAATPPLKGGEPDQEVVELVDEIQDMIDWEDGGHVTDWSCYGFAYARLVTSWRKAERYVERRQNGRMQTFILGWMKQGE